MTGHFLVPFLVIVSNCIPRETKGQAVCDIKKGTILRTGGHSVEGNDKKPYWSKEIADMLGIGTSTLRKWCLILERNGYRFLRDEHDRREIGRASCRERV